MTPSETRSATAPGIIPEPAAACCVAHTRANAASRGMTKSSPNTTRKACARKRPACSTMFYNEATGGTGYQSTFYTLHGKNIVHMTNASNNCTSSTMCRIGRLWWCSMVQPTPTCTTCRATSLADRMPMFLSHFAIQPQPCYNDSLRRESGLKYPAICFFHASKAVLGPFGCAFWLEWDCFSTFCYPAAAVL